jgi:hypothetical protein
MMSLKQFFDVASLARAHDLRFTCPPSYALGYCEELNMKKKYEEKTRMRVD